MAPDEEDHQVQALARQGGQSLHERPLLAIIGQGEAVAGVWVIHVLHQLAQGAHEVVGLLAGFGAPLRQFGASSGGP